MAWQPPPGSDHTGPPPPGFYHTGPPPPGSQQFSQHFGTNPGSHHVGPTPLYPPSYIGPPVWQPAYPVDPGFSAPQVPLQPPLPPWGNPPCQHTWAQPGCGSCDGWKWS
ncbi:hypothetical protein ABEB36_009011 [Hypothenemus hampei]|uniref:Uncharacterized protein n=1 Tax=Hypothenemus hampei TaxID=57062 RepID=A0ABD1ENU4_HYPHA